MSLERWVEVTLAAVLVLTGAWLLARTVRSGRRRHAGRRVDDGVSVETSSWFGGGGKSKSGDDRSDGPSDGADSGGDGGGGGD
jgi:hypothetical protein